MKLLNRFTLAFIAITFVATAPSCNKIEGCMDVDAINYNPNATEDCCCEFAETFDLTVNFQQVVGTSTMAEGNTYLINGVQTKLDISRLYISNIRLVNAAGMEFPAEGTYILTKPGTTLYAVNDLEPDTYTKIKFDLGVDSVTNHADPSTYPLNHPLGPQFPSMHWGWDFGYIFLRVDGFRDTNGDGTPDASFEMHIGKDENVVPFEFSYAITANGGSEQFINLDINWAKLFTGLDMTGEITTHTTDNPSLTATLVNNMKTMISLTE